MSSLSPLPFECLLTLDDFAAQTWPVTHHKFASNPHLCDWIVGEQRKEVVHPILIDEEPIAMDQVDNGQPIRDIDRRIS